MASPQPIPGRCGARTRTPGPDGQQMYCDHYPYKGSDSGRCTRHGGKSLRGVAHPRWRGGKGDRYVPKNLRSAYERALQAPQLASVRRDIALLDARLDELLRDLDRGQGSAATLLDQAVDAWQTVRAGLLQGASPQEVAAAQEAASDLTRLLASGRELSRAWGEVRAVLEQRRKAVETEVRAAERASGTMTREEGVALVGAFLAALREAQAPRPVLVKVQDKLRRLLGAGEGDEDVVEGEVEEA